MKLTQIKIAAALAISTFMVLPANAHHTTSVQATISRVDPITTSQVQHMPRQHCENVQVPVYSTVQGPGATGSDVLGGMILGGLLGKGLTGDDKGAAMGAILGGVTQADKQSSKRVISGYQTQQQCSTVYDEVRKNIITGYQIYFTYEGMSGTATTNTMYNVGDKIQVKMGISID